MADNLDESFKAYLRENERGHETLDKLLAVARPSAVFSEPVQSGEYTLITASEVTAGVGFGLGGGLIARTEKDEEGDGPQSGFGGGGGGGGGVAGRPVAVITISPEGVEIEPVVDVTKLGIALFTTLGGMFLMFSRMRRISRG